MATDGGCGQKGGHDGYSECHYHSTNHVTAIRPVLHVFEVSRVHHGDKKSEIYGNFVMSVQSNWYIIKYSKP